MMVALLLYAYAVGRRSSRVIERAWVDDAAGDAGREGQRHRPGLSRNIKTPRGYMQGYNAEAVCKERQIVVAAGINVDSPVLGHLEPMVSAAERELAGAGVAEAPAVVVADAGYWHHDQMDAVAGRGIHVLIPPDAGKRKGTRPGWDGGRYNRRIDRFSRRGRSACRSEWWLITATHNLLKLHRSRAYSRWWTRGGPWHYAAPARRLSPGDNSRNPPL